MVIFNSYVKLPEGIKMGYTSNEIAIFRRDNDQQNHWVQWGTNLFSVTHPKVIRIHDEIFMVLSGNRMENQLENPIRFNGVYAAGFGKKSYPSRIHRITSISVERTT